MTAALGNSRHLFSHHFMMAPAVIVSVAIAASRDFLPLTASFSANGKVLHMTRSAVARVPPRTPHKATTLGAGRDELGTFFSADRPGASAVNTDGDGRLSREEAPLLVKAQFERYDTDHDGFITLDDAQGWD